MKQIIKFVRESISEMKKVSWPSKDEVIVSTRVVVISVIMISLLLGFVDYVFFRVVNFIL